MCVRYARHASLRTSKWILPEIYSGIWKWAQLQEGFDDIWKSFICLAYLHRPSVTPCQPLLFIPSVYLSTQYFFSAFLHTETIQSNIQWEVWWPNPGPAPPIRASWAESAATGRPTRGKRGAIWVQRPLQLMAEPGAVHRTDTLLVASVQPASRISRTRPNVIYNIYIHIYCTAQCDI